MESTTVVNHFVIAYIQCGDMILKIVEDEKSSSDELSIRVLFHLQEERGVVLWSNHGLFRLIPIPIVRNAYQAYCAARRLEDGFSYHGVEVPDGLKEISWDQGIPVPPELVPHLISTAQEPLSDPDTATEPASKKQSS